MDMNTSTLQGLREALTCALLQGKLQNETVKFCGSELFRYSVRRSLPLSKALPVSSNAFLGSVCLGGKEPHVSERSSGLIV